MSAKRLLSNQEAWYVFEDRGSGFRLLRILNGRRTHDFFFPARGPIWYEDGKSGEYECELSTKEFVDLLTDVYTCYDRYGSTYYMVGPKTLTKLRIKELIAKSKKKKDDEFSNPER